jgi:hypothetical protein
MVVCVGADGAAALTATETKHATTASDAVRMTYMTASFRTPRGDQWRRAVGS